MTKDYIVLPVGEFTEATIEGTGIFDVLMRANKAHLEQEFAKNRIKGPEYATVYLGSLEQTMQTALQFFIEGRKSRLEERLLEKQIELADVEVQQATKKLAMMDCEEALCRATIRKTDAETAMVTAQMGKIPHEIEMAKEEAALAKEKVLLTKEEILIAKANLAKIAPEIAQINAQTALITAQAGKIPHEITLAQREADLAAERILVAKEEVNIAKANLTKIPVEVSHLQAQTDMVTAQIAKIPHDIEQAKQESLLAAEKVLVAKEEVLIAKANLTKIPAEVGLTIGQTALIREQTANAITENATMIKQQCKLAAEYDLLMLQKAKVNSESALLTQKVATEKAQVTGMGVDVDSVIGKQKALYTAQTEGFKRNAEHQMAKLMVDTWTVRRTTDENEPADATNKLYDPNIGKAIAKALSGIGVNV